MARPPVTYYSLVGAISTLALTGYVCFAAAHTGSGALYGPVALRETCQAQIVETIPKALGYSKSIKPIYESLLEMIGKAQKSIKIASWFIALSHPNRTFNIDEDLVEPGEKILAAFEAAAKRGVKIVIVVGRRYEDSEDLKRLSKVALVHHLDHDRSLGLESEMQSKFVLVDEETFYIGSTDLVWSAFSLNKSLGMTFTRCKSLAKDLNKIFQTYIQLAENSPARPSAQVELPERLHTALNQHNPMNITLQSETYKMYLSGSHANLTNRTGRTSDLDALLSLIDSAKEYIYISIPDYSERFAYTSPKDYWPELSNALKRAAFGPRNVRVRLLVDASKVQRGDCMMWIKSLNALNKVDGTISTRLFAMPEDVYSRFKTDSYVVTDRGMYLGTGSWMPDYFTKYATVGLVIEPTTLRKRALLEQMKQIFWRDYYSMQTSPVS